MIRPTLADRNRSSAHFYVFDGTEGLLRTVEPDRPAWEALRGAWDRFMTDLQDDVPPQLTERDCQTRSDPEWTRAAKSYLALKEAAENVGQQLDTAKEKLISLATHPSVSGAGVKVTRFWRQGSVDYKKIPELVGVDLEGYRKKGGFETRVSVGR